MGEDVAQVGAIKGGRRKLLGGKLGGGVLDAGGCPSSRRQRASSFCLHLSDIGPVGSDFSTNTYTYSRFMKIYVDCVLGSCDKFL